MTSNSRGEMTVQAINQALARRSVSLPELAEFARARDLPRVHSRAGIGFPAVAEKWEWLGRPGVSA